MDVFTEAAAGYATRLSPEDVHAALVARFTATDDSDGEVPTLADVGARLEQLNRWGNLSQDHDSSRATSLDAYARTAYVYDLTPGGEAAAGALATLEDNLRRVGGLQTVALRQIEEMLGDLVDHLRSREPDGARIYSLSEDLHTRFKSLTGNASLFMQKVNRLLNSPMVEIREFSLFKADTITYINDFIEDLDTMTTHVRKHLDALERIPTPIRESALAAGESASGHFALDEGPDAETWAKTAEAHLAGLAEWFRAAPDARTGAALLYAKAQEAILGIARMAERIREASTSPSSRSADFFNLAARFEQAGGDDEAHTLWHGAFGLASARHFGHAFPNDTLPATTSWWEEASRVTVSRQLWAAGRTDYVRRAMHVTDRGLAKGALAARARQTEDRIARAAETLTRLGTVTIAEVNARVVGPLDSTALRLLSSLLSRAWKSRVRRDGTRQAVSLDGALQITVLEPLLPQAARLIATSGTWTLPNYTICVELCEHVRTAERAAADLVGLSQDRTKRR